MQLKQQKKMNQLRSGRSLWLIYLLLPSLLVGLLSAPAAARERSTADFWSKAQKILASQANWFDRAEIALTAPDPLVNQILSTKLLVQLRSMDLFVQRYYRNPPALCRSPRTAKVLGIAAGLDPRQVETYCAVYQLSRDLTPLRERLTQRSSLFNPKRSKTINRFFTQSRAVPFAVSSVEQVNLASRVPVTSPSRTFLYPQKVGVQRFKRFNENYRPTVPPAITPPPALIRQLNQGRSQLLKIQAGLPATSQSLTAKAIQVFKPKAVRDSRFSVRRSEADIYRDFLSQPNTGITRVYPAQAFVVSSNRLQPRDVPMPFGLRIESGQFLLSGEALNYGFLTSLGDIALDDIQDDRKLPKLFTQYVPPSRLAMIQNHQRRFLVGKDTPHTSEAAAQLQQTYIMRVVQYQLPEVVTTGRPLQPGERGDLAELLKHQGRSRLVVFRPVIRRRDGSYTILWKVLDDQPAPQIRDLENYVSTNLKTRSRY